jgi:hypothetical protein
MYKYPTTAQQDLDEILAKYPEDAARVKNGSLLVKIDEKNWVPSYWDRPYTRISLPLAFQIAHATEANDFHIYYDRNEDFQHVAFRLKGKQCDIRWYKVFALVVDGEQQGITYPHDDAVVRKVISLSRNWS